MKSFNKDKHKKIYNKYRFFISIKNIVNEIINHINYRDSLIMLARL